jgi:hypothetical protein
MARRPETELEMLREIKAELKLGIGIRHRFPPGHAVSFRMPESNA